MTINIPSLKVYVRNNYLGLTDSNLTEAYLIAVTSISNRPLFFTAHLVTGAVWGRLPISAIVCDRYLEKQLLTQPQEIPLAKLQPYSCLYGNICYVRYEHLKDYVVKTKTLGKGYYLFTIDVEGPGLAEDPEQHKTHNIIALESGNTCALPNNYCLFTDEYFACDLNVVPKYKRNPKYFLPGG